MKFVLVLGTILAQSTVVVAPPEVTPAPVASVVTTQAPTVVTTQGPIVVATQVPSDQGSRSSTQGTVSQGTTLPNVPNTSGGGMSSAIDGSSTRDIGTFDNTGNSNNNGIQLSNAGIIGIIIGACAVIFGIIGFCVIRIRAKSKNKESLIDLQQVSLANRPNQAAPADKPTIIAVPHGAVFDPATGVYFTQTNLGNQPVQYVEYHPSQGQYAPGQYSQGDYAAEHYSQMPYDAHSSNDPQTASSYHENGQYFQGNPQQYQEFAPEGDSQVSSTQSKKEWTEMQLKHAQDVLEGKVRDVVNVPDGTIYDPKSGTYYPEGYYQQQYTQSELVNWYAEHDYHSNQTAYLDRRYEGQYVDENGRPYSGQEIDAWNAQNGYPLSESRSNASSRPALSEYPQSRQEQPRRSNQGRY